MKHLKHTTHAIPSLLLIITLVGFPQISETIYSPALPNIVTALNTTDTLVQWTLSIYFLGFALGVFFWGRLSDHLGRRPTMLLGILIYGLSSLGCLLSNSIESLLAFRIVQAFGASVGSVVTQAIIRESFEGSLRQKVFSTISIALSLSPALGPFIGGYINEWFDWRANFTVLVILSILIFIYAFFTLPETLRKNHPTQVKSTIKLFEVGLKMLKDKHVLGCTWLIAAVNGLLFSYYAEAPFIFIEIIGISPSQYGWLGIFIGSAAMLGAMLSHKWATRLTIDNMISLGCFIMMISGLILSLVTGFGLIRAEHSFLSILLIMIPMGGLVLGSFGLITPAVLTTALKEYAHVLGTAGAWFGLAYYVLIAALTWFMGVIHNGTPVPMAIYFLGLSLSCWIVFRLSLEKSSTTK